MSKELMSANVVLASTNSKGKKIVTLHAHYPRFIHAEIMTHRVFSRNARSSRAVPVSKMIEEVKTTPVVPWHWGLNQSGMQAKMECMNSVVLYEEVPVDRKFAWNYAARKAVSVAEAFAAAGYHKQIVNRILEPFMWIDTLITATDWDNFFELRCHEDAEPHLQDLANLMKRQIENTEHQELKDGEWHLPYIKPEEKDEWNTETLLKLSAARCARISYSPFNGESNIEKEMERYDRLINSHPMHASPIEHQAKATSECKRYANFSGGWIQYRTIVEGETR